MAHRLRSAIAAATALSLAACAVTLGLSYLIHPLLAILITGLVAGVAMGVGLCLILHRHWVEPLAELTKKGKQIVEADWRGQVQPDGATEIREMTAAFNRLAVVTHRRLDLLQHQQADLNALVDTLPDPILACDRKGRLILMNAPAVNLLRIEAAQALGKPFVSVISDEPVVELFEAVAGGGGRAPGNGPAGQTTSPATVQREVRLSRNGQKLTCQAVATRTADSGTLLVLRDVSELARAMQMKTDFVANASHELRTPITTIKIAFETLLEAYADDPEQAYKCMNVIDGNLRRLEDMLRDLLDLSRVENPDQDASAVAAVTTADLFNAVRGALSPLAQQKLVELSFEDSRVPRFKSDLRILNLILKNLVENGIKYTPVGGKVTVSITTLPDESDVILTVSDTGIGIAPEHIDRVFERFYQVDSARSGTAGRGTGLGLAIVKHAVAALGGTVKLESAVGVGTTVKCVFPKTDSDAPVHLAQAEAR
jgi:two-component system phosphate regulon sensor histidine kinase PhoR